MLPGFPKSFSKERIAPGHYVVTREDGKRFEIRRGNRRWWINSAWTVKSLGVALFDIMNGYTAGDQLAAEHEATARKYGF